MTTDTEQNNTTPTAGRPASVSFEQYEKAIETLSDDSGRLPSQRAIRRHLGSGSNSTLSNYRNRYLENALASDQPTILEPAHDKLFVLINEIMRGLTTEAAQLADDRVDEIERSARSRITNVEKQLDKQQRAGELLKFRADTAESDIKTARKEALEITEALNSLRAEHITLTERHNQTTSELADRQATINALQAKLESSQQENQTLSETHARSDAAQKAQIDALARHEQSLEAKVQQLTKVQEQSEGQLKKSNQSLQQLSADHRVLLTEHKTLNSKAETLQNDTKITLKELHSTQVAHDQAVLTQRDYEQRIAGFAGRLAEKDTQIERLTLALMAEANKKTIKN